jgi:hypothetical protein
MCNARTKLRSKNLFNIIHFICLVLRSNKPGRKRPFLIVFRPFGSDCITAVFHRIVNKCKRSDTRFLGRLRLLLTVHATIKKTTVILSLPEHQFTAMYDRKLHKTRVYIMTFGRYGGCNHRHRIQRGI